MRHSKAERSKSLLTDTRGLTTVEYILVLALIAIAGHIGWQTLGGTIAAKVMGSEQVIASLDGTGGGGAGAGAGAESGEVGASGGVGGARGGLTTSDDGAGSGGIAGESATVAGVTAAIRGTAPGAGSTPMRSVDASDGDDEDGMLGRGESTGLRAVARGVFDGVADVVGGTVDGVVAIGSGAWDAVTHPIDTATAVAGAVTHVVTHPVDSAVAAYDTAGTVVTGAIYAGSEMIDACASGDGYACSRGVTNVAATFVPIGAAGTVARGAGVARAGAVGARVSRRANQIDDSASAATTVGRRGQRVNFPNPGAPSPRNAPGTVNGREFSGHAFDRLQERGFTPTVVENAIQRGSRTEGSVPGTFDHVDPVNKIKVVTDAETGRVITVF